MAYQRGGGGIGGIMAKISASSRSRRNA